MITRGIALLVVAGIAFGVLRLTYGQRPAYVHVRWASTVDEETRMRIQQTHGLTRGEWREGTTWGYYITDVSSANLRDLVQNSAVEDTHNIHRTAFRIWRTAPRGDYVTTRPAWLASILEFMIPAGVVLGAVMLAVGAFKARRVRPRQPAPVAS